MIVVDASALAEWLLALPGAARIGEAVLGAPGGAHAPALLDAEILHVLRRHQRSGRLSPARAEQCLADLIDVPVARYPLTALLDGAWALRENLSAYDAFYLALARGLGASLLTTDRGMASAAQAQTEVEVVALG